jgi:hypothetical protein
VVGGSRYVRGAVFSAAVISASPSAHADPDSTTTDEVFWGLGSTPYRREPEPSEFALRNEEKVPPGYRVEERARRGPLIAGAIVGGLGYGLGVLAAGGDDFENQKGWLLLPVVGPWITLGARDDSCPKDASGECCTEPGCPGSFAGPALVFDGLMQGAGALLIVIAFAAPQRWAVRETESSVVVVPQLGSGRLGLSISGTL